MESITQEKNGSFNCDREEEKSVKSLIKKFNIQCCIETGTYTGCTTEWFSKLVEQVYTVEIDEKLYNNALQKFKNINNIKITKANSKNWLKTLLPTIKDKYKYVLFYLDAHWEKYWPLIDELKIISEHYNNDNGFIIVIDDFKVPNRNFQFDKYKEQPNNIDFIKDSMNKLPEHIWFYKNRSDNYHPRLRPNCCGVGKIYIISKNLLEKYNVKEEELYVIENGEKYNI